MGSFPFRCKKIQILTILPEYFNANMMCDTFGTTKHMAKIAVQLREKEGILAMPGMKCGSSSLSITTLSLVKSHYESDECSRMLPGKKDNISIKSKDGSRAYVQKRLVLSNLKELYQHFKEKHPNCKVGFSKFAELRPKQCILAGGSGTHTVCVCTYHENVKLMLDGK